MAFVRGVIHIALSRWVLRAWGARHAVQELQIFVERTDAVTFTGVEDEQGVGAKSALVFVATREQAMPFEHKQLDWRVGRVVFFDNLAGPQGKQQDAAIFIYVQWRTVGIGFVKDEFV